MHCTNCGAEAPEGAKFCGSCGQALPVVVDAAASVQGATTATAASQEPVAQQPAAEPVAQQAVMQEPVAQPAAQPAAAQPVYTQPAAQQPAAAQPVTMQPVSQQPVYQQPVYQQSSNQAYGGAVPFPRSEGDNNLLMIAFICNIVFTVLYCWLILPLAWMIPMTVVSYGVWKGKRRNTVAFGVCTLLFVNIISGILMLVCNKDE